MNVTNDAPIVSVIMPNYNTPIQYLKESIDSILNQSFSNLELIIIDDFSSNDSLLYIESISDERVIVLKNMKNMGPAYARNRGLDAAHGKYIVIMDSDDISSPNRIKELVTYMEEHCDVLLCGSWMKTFGDSINEYIVAPKLKNPDAIKVSLLFGCSCIMVPIIRKSVLDCNRLRYSDSYSAANDYKFWVDCSRYGKFSVLPKVLYMRRMQKCSITMSKGELQQHFRWKIIQEQLDELHFILTEDDRKYYNCINSPRKLYDLRTKEIIHELILLNSIYKIYNHRVLKHYLWNRWAVISAYGIKNQKSIKKRIRIVLQMPVSRYYLLLKESIRLVKEKYKAITDTE